MATNIMTGYPLLNCFFNRIISDEFVRRDEFYEYMKRSDERFERGLGGDSSGRISKESG